MEVSLGDIDLSTLAQSRTEVTKIFSPKTKPDSLGLATTIKKYPEVTRALSYFHFGDTSRSKVIPNTSIPGEFVACHPSAFDYVVFSRDYVQGIIQTERPDLVQKVSDELMLFGADIYGAEWEDLNKNLKKPRKGFLKVLDRAAALVSKNRVKNEKISPHELEARAYVQSLKFAKQGRISEKLLPGFFDGGRESRFIGPFFVPSDSNNREIIVVDPRIDSTLQLLMQESQKIGQMHISEADKLLAVVTLVDQHANRYGQDLDTVRKRIGTGQMLIDIPLGRFFRGKDPGLAGIAGNCRHYAKMLHICATEAGFASTLVKGTVQTLQVKSHSHEWTEITINDQLYIGDMADLSGQGINDKSRYTLSSNGIHPLVNDRIIASGLDGSHSGNKYIVKGRTLYTVS